MRKNGFTLVEVLIIVVIVGVVSVFAVSSYRTSQRLASYTSAEAILMELGNASRNYRIATGINMTSAQITLPSQEERNKAVQVCTATAGTWQQLYYCGYLSPIHMNASNEYRGYHFYVCNPTTGSTQQGCCTNERAACMRYNRTDSPRYSQLIGGVRAAAWMDWQGNLGDNYDHSAKI